MQRITRAPGRIRPISPISRMLSCILSTIRAAPSGAMAASRSVYRRAMVSATAGSRFCSSSTGAASGRPASWGRLRKVLCKSGNSPAAPDRPMGGEDLLDQTRSGTRQTDDEHGAGGEVAPGPALVETSGREGRNHPLVELRLPRGFVDLSARGCARPTGSRGLCRRVSRLRRRAHGGRGRSPG